MSYRKVQSWFVSESGRKFSFGVASVTGLGAFCLHFVPNTFLIDKYKDIVHYYRNGVAVTLKPELIERFNKALDLAEVAPNTKNLYKSFSVIGFDIFSAGTSASKFGCLIGLPVNFAYNNVDSIEKQNIKILSESVVWDSKEAKDFLNSLVLSEKAQMYAMAREIRMTQTWKVYANSMYATLAVYCTYAVSQFLNMRYNFYVKPLGLRLPMYGLIATFFITNYCFVKDFTQLKFERKVDEELKHLNPMFTEGAIEFYGKALERNKALRKLMGKEGESMYSVHGNENYLLRQKHLPLVQRKAYFENKLDPKESFVKEYA